MIFDVVLLLVAILSVGFGVGMFASGDYDAPEEPWLTADLDHDPFENGEPTPSYPTRQTLVMYLGLAEPDRDDT